VAYAVELRFDQNLAQEVRGLWRALEEIGAGGFGPGGDPVPHLSLAVYDDEGEVDEAAAGGMVAVLAAQSATIDVEFASLGVFPTEERVLFLAPVVTPPLLDIHAAYHAMARALGATCRPYYLPGRWVPHCTLSMLGPMAGVQEGLGHLAPRWRPLHGMIRAAALIRVPPLATLVEYPLKGSVVQPVKRPGAKASGRR
jgi:hypothetical protein